MQRLQSVLNLTQVPSSADRGRTLYLYALITMMLIMDLLFSFALPIDEGQTLMASALANGYTLRVIVLALVPALLGLALGLLYVRRLDAASWLTCAVLLVGISLVGLRNGFDTAGELATLNLLLVISGLLLQTTGLLVFGGLAVAVYLTDITSRAVQANNLQVFMDGLPAAVIYMVTIAAVYLLIRLMSISRSEGEDEAGAERSKLAEITTQITRQASQRVDMKTALDRILTLLLEGYPQIYHVQVFLIDDDNIQARLVASTGETGQRLISRGHKLAVGSLSVIGQTTFKGQPVISRSDDPDSVHRHNELLPDTTLEVAFPLRVEDDIIGALDLQSRTLTRLDEDDMYTFQSLADSLSLVIDNIRQFEEAQERIEENRRLAEQARTALYEVDRLNKRLIGRAWSEYLDSLGEEFGLDVDFASGDKHQTSEWTPTLRQAITDNDIIEAPHLITVPLRVRGAVIGAVEFEMPESRVVSNEDLELVQEISDRFGLAAENMRLVEESQRIAQREGLINEISSRFQASNNDVESTLAEAARSLSETLSAQRVAIRLGTPPKPSKNGGSSNPSRTRPSKNGREDT